MKLLAESWRGYACGARWHDGQRARVRVVRIVRREVGALELGEREVLLDDLLGVVDLVVLQGEREHGGAIVVARFDVVSSLPW